MIEIPEGNTLAKQLSDVFLGKKVTFVEAAHTAHGFAFYNHEAEQYHELLCGKKLTKTCAAGGQVELIFEDMHLVLSDGATPRSVADRADVPKKHQLVVLFEGGEGFFCTVRMYGGFMLYPQGKSDNPYYTVSKEKPSPLSAEFDEAYFNQIVSETDAKLSAKALLATEQRIPGLGNGVLQDILFNAGVHPQKKVKDMSSSDIQALYASIKKTLCAMTEQGGRNTEKDLFGNKGGYQCILCNQTKDLPCPRCGGALTKKAFLGGNVYFCPVDQSL